MTNIGAIIAILVCGVGMILFYGLMDYSPRSPRKIVLENGEFHMPDMRFHYTADELYATFTLAGDERARMKRYWLLDFGFILCFLGAMLLIALNVVGLASPLFALMAVAAVARALLDAVENLCFLRLYRLYPARNDTLARIASLVTSAKFVFLFLWVAMLFYRLFIRAFGLA